MRKKIKHTVQYKNQRTENDQWLCRNPTNKEQVRLAILAALYAIILNLISLFWAFVFIDLMSSPIVFLITKNIVSTLDL
jgi:hypothetical protein